ncbi:GAF domain-containing sensor histidine kinase [Aquimarina intermedia]|uniref:histidine kinase n=1 Tax=Aquimarina intermedia TaxID=350814 RepID=A0A5S5C9D2_9FLAO|nr:GAF domain-containing sensor histidine kinase [Aquimarina intermedia]TYP75954.1 GAF sensor signal transduction histidine kinase [Aquimarina intermedia]
MISPLKSENENSRLIALKNLQILDTLPENEYDNITELAAFICNTNTSLVSLIDEERQWFKSRKNMPLSETHRDHSFCAHAINNPRETFIIPHATKDERFHDNPLTLSDTPVIFYAGVPLLDKEGHALGTLCVIDDKPNTLSPEQEKALKNLALQVEKLFELRKANNELKETKENLEKHNNLLKDFAGVASHDMKMPLSNMIITSDLLQQKYGANLDESGSRYLSYIKKSALSLSNYITNILEHYESTAYNRSNVESFDVNTLLENIVELLHIKYDCEVHLPDLNIEATCNRIALEQIFLNLIANSLKYNDKDPIQIFIDASVFPEFYEFSVRDNGIGIEPNQIDSIFELFTTVGHLDRDGNKGHGIGLSTVQKLVETLKGTITVDSQIGSGTTFTFTVAK